MISRTSWIGVVIAILLSSFYLLPVWSAFTASLKSLDALYTTSPLILPSALSFENYVIAFNTLKNGFLVTIIISVSTVIISLFIGSISAFKLSKFKLKGATVLIALISLGVLMPFNAYLIPTILSVSFLGIYDTILALILVHVVYGLPTTLLLFTGYYVNIPDSLIEAARLDGAGDWMIYRRIVLSLSGPIFVVVSVLRFTFSWNDLFYGLILTKQANRPIMTLVAGLKGGEYAMAWHILMAGTILSILPTLVVYIFLGRFLIRGYLSEITKA